MNLSNLEVEKYSRRIMDWHGSAYDLTKMNLIVFRAVFKQNQRVVLLTGY